MTHSTTLRRVPVAGWTSRPPTKAMAVDAASRKMKRQSHQA